MHYLSPGQTFNGKYINNKVALAKQIIVLTTEQLFQTSEAECRNDRKQSYLNECQIKEKLSF